MRNRTLTYSAVGTLALGLSMASAANAQVSMEAGDWDITFDGNVNGFYIIQDPETSPETVDGGLAAAGEDAADTHNIRTGLLPAKLGMSAATTQDGWDIEAYVSYWPGIDSNTALNTNQDSVNFRQVYFSFGNDNVGTFKIGRDLGIFQSEAILNDMTLLGVGTVGGPVGGGGNTTLGRIGVGYLYADWKAQFSYQTPMINGFQATVGVMEPWNTMDDLGESGTSAAVEVEGEQPGIEGKLTYDFSPGGIDTRLWGGFITQEVDDGGDNDFTASGFEVGARATVGDLEGVFSYYNGSGIGTTAFLMQAVDNDGNERDSDGFYLQGVYTVPQVGTRLGVSYGESSLDQENDNDMLLDKNSSVIVGAYHPLTDNVNLVAEYTQTESENHDGDDNKASHIALGGIMFF